MNDIAAAATIAAQRERLDGLTPRRRPTGAATVGPVRRYTRLLRRRHDG